MTSLLSQSYRIWFMQPNGSTLLCKSLELTRVAGKLGEYFSNFQITPVTLAHEDVIQDFSKMLFCIFFFLEIEGSEEYPEMYDQGTADKQ